MQKEEKARHSVKRAIILAAGVGARMLPLTEKVPKPLVEVNGVRMVDSVVDALHKNGIMEIYVVVGHLKGQFRYLEETHPGLVLVENPYYKTCNNISSLYVVREHLEEAMVLDGDQVIYRPSVLTPAFERSGYNVVWTDSQTSEWLMDVEDGVVVSCSRTGGLRGWQLYSISRWTKEDGQKLKRHLEWEFIKKKNQQLYWDDLALFCYPQEYQLGIYEMHKGDVVEIDSLDELASLDARYQGYF